MLLPSFQAEVRGSGLQMAVISPDFVEPFREGGSDVDRIQCSERNRIGQSTRQHLHLSKNPAGDGNQVPDIGRNMIKEIFAQPQAGFRGQTSFAELTMDR